MAASIALFIGFYTDRPVFGEEHFAGLHADMMEVVELARNGSLDVQAGRQLSAFGMRYDSLLALPEQYGELSHGGGVYYHHHDGAITVLFVYERDWFEGAVWQAYMYTEADRGNGTLPAYDNWYMYAYGG